MLKDSYIIIIIIIIIISLLKMDIVNDVRITSHIMWGINCYFYNYL